MKELSLDVETRPSPTAGVRVLRPRRVVTTVVLLALLVLGASVAWHFYHFAMTHETTDDAFVEGHISQISARVSGPVIRVLVSDNQDVKAGEPLAEIDPHDYQAKVAQKRAALRVAVEKQRSAAVDITLTDVTSSAGVDTATSTVAAAESGAQRARTEVAAAQANVQAARAHERQAHAQVVTAQRNYDQALAQIRSARAEAQRSAADEKRYRQLYGQDEVSRQQLDRAVATAREDMASLEASSRHAQAAYAQIKEARAAESMAADGVRQAEAQVSDAEGHVGEATAQVNQARGQLASARSAPQQVALKRTQAQAATADIAQAREDLREAELNLSYTHVVAPETGQVTRKSIEVGNYVQPGQALLAIVRRDVWVVANFKETQLTYMKAGQPVTIHVDAFPNRTFKGHVDSFQAGTGAVFSILPPENATGNHVKIVQRVPVKIVFDEPLDDLRGLSPGMSVEPAVEVR